MKYIPWLIMVTTLALTTSCRTRTSGSQMKGYQAPPMPEHLRAEFQRQNNIDLCGMWRVFLTAAIHDYIIGNQDVHRPGELHEYYVGNPTDCHITDETGACPPSKDIFSLLPISKGREIIDTIIKQENNRCTLEAIYQKPMCLVEIRDGARWEKKVPPSFLNPHFKHTVYLHPTYFKGLTGINLDQILIPEWDIWAHEALEKTFDIYAHQAAHKIPSSNYTRAGYGFYYQDITRNDLKEHGMVIRSNFGICMILKHKKYLADQGIFDFEPYLLEPIGEDHRYSIDGQNELLGYHKKSLNEFIEKTNKLSGATTPLVDEVPHKKNTQKDNTQNQSDTSKSPAHKKPKRDPIQPADPNL